DIGKRMASDAAFQSQAMGAIAGSPEMAGKMVDQLLAGDTRALVTDRVLADGAAVQGLMTKIAQDRTMLDGVLNLAVQDTAMKSHTLALSPERKRRGGKWVARLYSAPGVGARFLGRDLQRELASQAQQRDRRGGPDRGLGEQAVQIVDARHRVRSE